MTGWFVCETWCELLAVEGRLQLLHLPDGADRLPLAGCRLLVLELAVLVDAVLDDLLVEPGLPEGPGEVVPRLGQLVVDEDVLPLHAELASPVLAVHHGAGELVPGRAGHPVGEGDDEGLVVAVLLGPDAVAGVDVLLQDHDVALDVDEPADVVEVGLPLPLAAGVEGAAGDGGDGGSSPLVLPARGGAHDNVAFEAPLVDLIDFQVELFLLSLQLGLLLLELGLLHLELLLHGDLLSLHLLPHGGLVVLHLLLLLLQLLPDGVQAGQGLLHLRHLGGQAGQGLALLGLLLQDGMQNAKGLGNGRPVDLHPRLDLVQHLGCPVGDLRVEALQALLLAVLHLGGQEVGGIGDVLVADVHLGVLELGQVSLHLFRGLGQHCGNRHGGIFSFFDDFIEQLLKEGDVKLAHGGDGGGSVGRSNVGDLWVLRGVSYELLLVLDLFSPE